MKSLTYKLVIAPEAQADIKYWNKNNPKKVERIVTLLEAIQNNPFQGIGKPEALKHNWTGYWSRRIDRENRIIYRLKNNAVEVVSCRYHYKR